ncbi:MAG: HAD-IA family hydrolase [Verrucomicrobium sp.]|nr:HAD-IA family hydrolase [Verrucomicrobium sp.]
MTPLSCVFFDAAGTLFHLREPVGVTYARIAAHHEIKVEPDLVEKGFRHAWRSTPPNVHPVDNIPDDDDAAWWRELVGKTFEHAVTGPQVSPTPPLSPPVLDALFQDLYSHFARPEPWVLFDDTRPALEMLKETCPLRLFVLSNFDRRLHAILEGLGLAHYFESVILSSEVGASKPHPRIFATALELAGASAQHCLHIGDDPRCDLQGAETAGMQARLIDRPAVTLLTLAQEIKESAKK